MLARVPPSCAVSILLLDAHPLSRHEPARLPRGQALLYEDKRYCPHCAAYVLYLIALEVAYCARCDQKVCLFSDSDRLEFTRSLARTGAAEQEVFGSAFATGER